MPKLSVLAVLLALIFTGCASNKEEKAEKSSEQSVYESAQKYLRTSSWEAAAQTLELLEETFPFGTYAEQAQLELIYAYFRSNEHDSVIAASDRFIRLHPQHRNVDYAYYMRGIAAFFNDTGLFSALATDTTRRDPGSARESFNYFAQLLERFPTSPYAKDAQKRMIYLRNSLARSEINVANYYMLRGAYLAAANRGKYVVENFQLTPAVPDGLAVMAQAYKMMEMDDLSEDAAEVLTHNYPDHPALDNDGKFNYKYASRSSLSWFDYLTLGLFSKKQGMSFDTRERYNAFYSRRDLDSVPPPN
ncbi:MAG: outer membrane protein assembly factor BamD [Cellvibrionaceae bacterium]|nr:outer membrane protein assembly factor BamD [Cellvibrionaceae bacterium]